jgi:hypothetical protein
MIIISEKSQLIVLAMLLTLLLTGWFANLDDVAFWQVGIFGLICAAVFAGFANLLWPREARFAILADGVLVRNRITDKSPLNYHCEQEAETAAEHLVIIGALKRFEIVYYQGES